MPQKSSTQLILIKNQLQKSSYFPSALENLKIRRYLDFPFETMTPLGLVSSSVSNACLSSLKISAVTLPFVIWLSKTKTYSRCSFSLTIRLMYPEHYFTVAETLLRLVKDEDPIKTSALFELIQRYPFTYKAYKAVNMTATKIIVGSIAFSLVLTCNTYNTR